MARATSKGETAPSKNADAAFDKCQGAGQGRGTRASPWTRQTPSLSSEFVALRDEQLDPPALVVHGARICTKHALGIAQMVIQTRAGQPVMIA